MNNVALIGRLTKDPELRFISGSGSAVAQLTLAVDKNLSKEKKQQFELKNKPTADFIRVVVWGKQAENCANFLEKGLRVAIQGSISVTKYESSAGETRYSTDVMANNVEFLEWKDKNKGQSKGAATFDEDFANDFRSIEDDDDIPF
jgi:single-strand DNA-binding protein